MSDAARRLVIPFAAISALFIGILAVAQPAKALEGMRGGFGGVQGWGGLYRDNRDVGSFPIYITYSDGYIVEQTYPRRHSQVYRHSQRRHHRAVAHYCAAMVHHCVCCH
jgi:hypothetical protein